MAQVWRSARAMQRLAMVLLLLALAGIAASYTASQKAVAIQGPGALQAVSPEQLWLGVNDELWVLDRAGQRTAVRRAADFGVAGAISNIVPAAPGQVLLSSREQREWQLVDVASLARIRTVRPQWPIDFADKPLNAVHLAVAANGDIAAATGGGHAVLLFDGTGRFKARTAPGTFRFTNGLWWSPEGWWTTDTNRFALRLLDAQTLAVTRSVQLAALPAAFPYLGEAQASHGQPQAGSDVAPFATITRLGYLMEPGHVVDVFPDGTQALFNGVAFSQLRDIGWFDGHLLAVDGGSYLVHRFSADRARVAPFGSAQVRDALQAMHTDRAFWLQLGSRHALALAIVLLLAGVLAYLRHRRLAARDVVNARQVGRSVERLPDARQLRGQRWRVVGLPVLLRVLVLSAGIAAMRWLGGAAPGVPSWVQALLLVGAPLVLLAFWEQARLERFAHDPAYEETLNHRAVAWLRGHDDWDRVREEGEVPRESVYLPGLKARWLLVTNRRVLLFAASARERVLLHAWNRPAVLFAGPPEQLEGAAPRGVLARLLTLPPNLALRFDDATTLRVRCASAVTAARLARLLTMTAAVTLETGVQPGRRRRAHRRWHEVLAAFVVPGTGQWMQGRFATGLVLFVAAALLCVFGWLPVLWASRGPKMEVSPLTQVAAFADWLLLSLVSAVEAWRFSAAPRPRRR